MRNLVSVLLVNYKLLTNGKVRFNIPFSIIKIRYNISAVLFTQVVALVVQIILEKQKQNIEKKVE